MTSLKIVLYLFGVIENDLPVQTVYPHSPRLSVCTSAQSTAHVKENRHHHYTAIAYPLGVSINDCYFSVKRNCNKNTYQSRTRNFGFIYE